MHPDYPISAPLLQAWVATALGEWHESWVNIPWLLLWIALGLIFYGQARLSGISAVVAIPAAYLLLSMPYLNIHVALAGYADLLMAACYLAATAALYNWGRSREPWLLWLTVLSGGSCLIVKNEGLYWLLSLLPGMLLMLVGVRRGLLWLALLAVPFFVAVWLLPDDAMVAGHSLESLDITYRPEGWMPILQSFFIHDNWHLLGYFTVLALAVTAFKFHRELPFMMVLMSAIALYLVLYVLTSNSVGAVKFTSLNRVALHFMPSAAFFCLVVLVGLTRGRQAPFERALIESFR
jgi:hypothetical protein